MLRERARDDGVEHDRRGGVVVISDDVVRPFLERELIPADARTRFDAAIASAARLRNSVLVELLLVAVVFDC